MKDGYGCFDNIKVEKKIFFGAWLESRCYPGVCQSKSSSYSKIYSTDVTQGLGFLLLFFLIASLSVVTAVNLGFNSRFLVHMLGGGGSKDIH